MEARRDDLAEWQENGILSAMKTTIDKAGRIVIPKAIREQCGLTPGEEVEIRQYNGVIEIEPIATKFRMVRRGGRLIAEADREMPPASDEVVFGTIDRIRDELGQF